MQKSGRFFHLAPADTIILTTSGLVMEEHRLGWTWKQAATIYQRSVLSSVYGLDSVRTLLKL